MTYETNPTGSGSAAGGAHDNLEGVKAQAKKAADDIRSAASAKVDELRDKAGDYYDQARGRAEEYYGQARDQARTLQEDGEAYVRENPLRAVLMAAGAGFVLGLVFRK